MQTDFLEKVARAILEIDEHQIRGVNLLKVLRNKRFFDRFSGGDKRIFVIGNGGSASLASHFVNDLVKQHDIDAICLSDNISLLTALANDRSYEDVFAYQLSKLCRGGDILVVITSSGNSPNIIKAIETAKLKSMTIIALVGFDGGEVKEMLPKGYGDFVVHIPTEKGEYELVESVHGAVLHYLIQCLKK